jgi:thiamine biosynthesis lipoprotein
MNTVVEINFNSNSKNEEAFIDSLFDLIKKYDRILSYYEKNSELQKLNNSKKDTIYINNDFYQMLKMSKYLYDLSEGHFDTTIGTLTDLWNFEKAIVPDSSQINEAKKYVGFNKIKFSQNELIKINKMKLNFGAIAKGYIIDRVYDKINSNKNIINGFINAGGDIRLFDKGNTQQLIGIQHPRDRKKVIAEIKVNNKSVVTSGDYERFFIKNGVRYHHIIDPFTGKPSRNCISVTVIADNAFLADGLSTVCFLMSPKKAVALVNKLPNTEVLIYYIKNDKIVKEESDNIGKYATNEK